MLRNVFGKELVKEINRHWPVGTFAFAWHSSRYVRFLLSFVPFPILIPTGETFRPVRFFLSFAHLDQAILLALAGWLPRHSHIPYQTQGAFSRRRFIAVVYQALSLWRTGRYYYPLSQSLLHVQHFSKNRLTLPLGMCGLVVPCVPSTKGQHRHEEEEVSRFATESWFSVFAIFSISFHFPC